MDDGEYGLLVRILKQMEGFDIENKSIEDTVVNIIDSYQSYLTDEQRDNLIKKFIKYEKIRRGRSEQMASFIVDADKDMKASAERDVF